MGRDTSQKAPLRSGHRAVGHTRVSPGVIEHRSNLADVGEAGDQGGEMPGGSVDSASTPLTQGPPNKPGTREAPDGTTTTTEIGGSDKASPPKLREDGF